MEEKDFRILRIEAWNGEAAAVAARSVIPGPAGARPARCVQSIPCCHLARLFGTLSANIPIGIKWDTPFGMKWFFPFGTNWYQMESTISDQLGSYQLETISIPIGDIPFGIKWKTPFQTNWEITNWKPFRYQLGPNGTHHLE